MTSTTLSHRGGKLFYCMFLLYYFFETQRLFYYSLCFKGRSKFMKLMGKHGFVKLFFPNVVGDVASKGWQL